MDRRDRVLEVVGLYNKCHNAAQVGRALGISRERVRQICASVGVSTSRWATPDRPAKTCRDCDRPTPTNRHVYCDRHRLARIADREARRNRRAISTDAAQWRDLLAKHRPTRN